MYNVKQLLFVEACNRNIIFAICNQVYEQILYQQQRVLVYLIPRFDISYEFCSWLVHCYEYKSRRNSLAKK